MKQMVKRGFALLMVLVMCIGMIPVIGITADAATVEYTYGENNYIYNWGTRGTPATYLSPNAVTFYSTGNASYEYLSSLKGGTGTSDAPSSALYDALQDLMKSRHTHETDYGETRYQYQYTDCENSGNPKTISSFYSGIAIGPGWDGGDTWNREHTWPNSKGDASGNGENDIMMLRPASMQENSGRGNIAYGESSGYYHPNKESNYELDVRGDVSRIMLYVYTRWGNTGSMWGSNGVIESLDVLLKWMVEDPVDTWELGRNDSVESITGTRNVFVDYPELAFLLFGEEIPANMSTPSNEKPAQGHTHNATPSVIAATCVAEGCTLYTCSCGYSYKEDIVPALGHNFVNDVCTRCDAVNYNGKAVKIFYPAGSTYMTANSTTDGNKLLAGTADEAAAWRMTEGEKGYYTISFGGQYLIGSSDKPYLYLSDNLTDCGWWELIECENGYYLRNTGVFFNGSYNQYLEYYSGFTVYGFNSASASAYTFRLEVVGDGNTECEEHNWKDATCTTPKTCKTCGATEGSALGHKWQDATCQAPKTCSVCKVTEGEKAAHSYVNGACSVCGQTEPGPQATISFDDKANRTEFSTSKQVWEQNGVTITNNKGSSTSNVADYSKPARFYKNSTLIISYPGMIKIEVTCNTTSYANDLKNAITSGTATVNGKVVTITLPAAVDSYTAVLSVGQVRVDSITVYAATGGECTHATTKVEGASAATCTTAGHTGKTVCTNCNEVINPGEVIPATGHNYVNGTCSGCGKTEVVVTQSTISFANKAQRTIFNSNQQVWEQNGIVVTNDKAASNNAVADYANPARFYAGSKLTVAHPGMTKIVFTCGSASYATALKDSISGATVTVSGSVVTVTLPAAADTFTIAKLSAQVRMNSITVYAEGGSAEVCTHTNTKTEGATAPTCTVAGHTGKTVCADCGEVISQGNVIPANGHSYVNGTCTGCGEADPNFKPECQHTNTKVEGTSAATCTTAGHTGKTVCSDCGKTISEGSVIPATGHSYVNGTCTGCGDVKQVAAEATISFANKAQRTTFNANKQVWEQNGIVVTNDKAASSNAVADYANPARFYAGSKLTVSYPGMTKIEFTCNSSSYATALKNSITGAAVSVSGKVVTVTLSAPADTFTVAKLSAQVRMNSIKVYATAGGCQHDWKAATCTAPKTCKLCGETEGNVLAHSWIDATCTAPKTCSACKLTQGSALGHKWTDATCEAPETCSVCKLTQGDALGHKWTDATCENPAICTVCGGTGEPALGHVWIAATCEEYGYCDTCGAIGDDPMGHFYLREEYTAPTCEIEGTVVYVCMDCDDSYTETVEATGHELVDGACTVCGKQVEVVENEDGSVTETTTVVEKTENEDGSVTESTTVVEKTESEDGSVVTSEVVTETVTKEDGTVETVTKETVKAELSNGTTATTVIDSTGSVTSNVVLSEEAIAAIVEKAPIALPIPEVTVSASATVSIDLSGKKDDAAVKVELPVIEVNENAVIVIVHEDGTEEILQKTAVTANGLAFEVEGNVTVKVVDNTKEFEDVNDDNWSSAAVNFATSREILSGGDDGKFAPKSNMTCLQLTTLLFSMDNKSANLSSDEIEAKAAEWAETNQIIDSAFNGEETMTREQLADFIYRYAGASKLSGNSDRFAQFTDCDSVSSWARDAMIWAVEVGVINGMGDNTLNPNGKATREQVAQVLMNYINKQ